MLREMARKTVPWYLPTYFEVILICAFLAFGKQVTSYDLWWHLACGDEFWKRGLVMTTDDLSTGSMGAYWTPHYWGWAVIGYQIYVRGGLLALLLAKAALAAFTVQVLGWLLREQGVRHPAAFLVTVLVGIAGLFSQFWNLRAQSATGFGVFWITYLFARARRTGRLPWIVAPVTMCLWTNLHGGFIFGIVTWGAYFAAACLRKLGGRPTPLAPGPLLGLGALMVAACAINPYGPQYILYPFSYLGNVHLQTRITEWAGTVVRDYISLEIVILVTLVACALVPHASRLEEVGLAAICLHFVFQAARNIFLVGPWLSPLVGPRVDHLVEQVLATPDAGEAPAPHIPAPHFPAPDIFTTPMLTTPMPTEAPIGKDRVAWAWCAIALITVIKLGIGYQPPVRSDHPVKIVEWLKTNDVPKAFFNEYAQGGYVMFHLRGRYLPYVDGRADLHIDSGAFVEYTKLIDLREDWETVFFKTRGFRSALLEKGMPIGPALRARGWKQVGPDEPNFELLVAP